MEDDKFTGSEIQPAYTEEVTAQVQANPYMSAVAQPVKPVKVKKEKKFFTKVLLAMLLGLSFGAFAAAGFFGVSRVIDAQKTEVISTSTNVEDLEKSILDLQNALNAVKSGTTATTTTVTTNTATTVVTDVTSVVDKVMPSMVSVSNTYETTTSFFGRRYTQEEQSCGSGIIVGESDTEYFIATNYHVIADCKKLEVQFVDETIAGAYVKGYVEDLDIAVICVEKKELEMSTKMAITVAEMGDSDALRMGEPAIAIGNALGYGQSVTTGVISALNREIDLENSSSNLIQTSAAINPGNSGGALLNIKGQVVGINSSKIGATTVEGIGFAIPINEVKDIIGDLSQRQTKIKVDESEKGYLGIQGVEYDITSLGYPAGAYVAKVYEGSPAEKAGIYYGDIITKVDDQSISSFSDLKNTLAYYKVGDTLKIVVSRNVSGVLTEMELSVTLGSKDVLPTE